MWDELRDLWEWDSHARRQIIVAVIVAAIGLVACFLELGAQRWLAG